MHRPPIQSFAIRARQQCPPHAELALALAAEFMALDEVAVEERLDDLAAPLVALHGTPPRVQVGALYNALRPFALAGDAQGRDAFLLPRVLERRQGQPVLLACLGAELSRRAGMAVGVISDGERRFMVAHGAMAQPVALDAETDRSPERIVDPRRFAWRCAHEVAFAALGGIGRCAVRENDPEAAELAARLRLALPVNHATRARLDQELAGVLALSR